MRDIDRLRSPDRSSIPVSSRVLQCDPLRLAFARCVGIGLCLCPALYLM
jgi:hypothetical protein